MFDEENVLSIQSKEDKIIEELSLFSNTPSLLIDHLINIGSDLPSFSEEEKKGASLVPGCLAKVWLITTYQASRIVFRGDSNAAITKGLVGLLVRLYSGSSPTSIVKYTPTFPEVTGLGKILGIQRRSGLNSMLNVFRLNAQGLIR